MDAASGLTFGEEDLSARMQKTKVSGVYGLQERGEIYPRLIHRQSGWFIYLYFLRARHVEPI
jgi:hypothetical protein